MSGKRSVDMFAIEDKERKRRMINHSEGIPQKIAKWFGRASEAKQRFCCTNCFSQNIGTGEAHVSLSLCVACYKKLPKEDCFYCGIQFMYLDWFKEWKSASRVICCPDCIQKKMTYGEPKYCQTCKKQAAFGMNTCTPCHKGFVEGKQPVSCESCFEPCAFLEDGNMNENYCFVCKQRKEFGKKGSIVVQDQNQPETNIELQPDEEELKSRYNAVYREVKIKKAQLADKKATVKRMSEAEMAEKANAPADFTLQKKVAQLKAQLNKRMLDVVQMEGRLKQATVRGQIDIVQEQQKKQQITSSIQSRLISLTTDVHKLEAENSILRTDFQEEAMSLNIKNGDPHNTPNAMWPLPWHLEDSERDRKEYLNSKQDPFF